HRPAASIKFGDLVGSEGAIGLIDDTHVGVWPQHIKDGQVNEYANQQTVRNARSDENRFETIARAQFLFYRRLRIGHERCAMSSRRGDEAHQKEITRPPRAYRR